MVWGGVGWGGVMVELGEGAEKGMGNGNGGDVLWVSESQREDMLSGGGRGRRGGREIGKVESGVRRVGIGSALGVVFGRVVFGRAVVVTGDLSGCGRHGRWG